MRKMKLFTYSKEMIKEEIEKRKEEGIEAPPKTLPAKKTHKFSYIYRSSDAPLWIRFFSLYLWLYSVTQDAVSLQLLFVWAAAFLSLGYGFSWFFSTVALAGAVCTVLYSIDESALAGFGWFLLATALFMSVASIPLQRKKETPSKADEAAEQIREFMSRNI